jgi:hypothetical protein
VASLIALAVLLLTAGTTISVLLAVDANEERKKAEDSAYKANQETIKANHAREDATRKEKAATAAERLERGRRYGVGVLLMQAAWEQRQVDRFVHLLEGTQPQNVGDDDFRSFEWYHWKRQFHSGHSTLVGHTQAINSVCLSPDGKRLVSMSEDQTVKLWDVATGENILTLDSPARPVSSVPAFSADGKCLVSEDRDGKLATWDLATGKRVEGPVGKTVPGSPRSPDGRLVAVAEGKVIYLQRQPDDKDPERAGWRWWVDPAPWWHAEQAFQAEAGKERFAAAFHLSRLLVDRPADDKLRLRHDIAVKRLAGGPAPR